jgi:hypothetical protein
LHNNYIKNLDDELDYYLNNLDILLDYEKSNSKNKLYVKFCLINSIKTDDKTENKNKLYFCKICFYETLIYNFNYYVCSKCGNV